MILNKKGINFSKTKVVPSFCCDKMKGVSPLIAFVFLVLFAIVMASVISGWLIPLTQKEANTVRNQTQQKIACQYADLFIVSASLNCSNSCNAGTRHNISLQIKNTGSVPVTISNVYIQNKTGVIASFNWNETYTLSTGTIITLENNSFTSCSGYDNQTKMDKIILNSDDCPSYAYDSIASDQVAFRDC